MDAYVEDESVYFFTKERAAFARYPSLLTNKIESALLKVSEWPTLRPQDFTKSLKKYHAAEHKVYNCFMKKIRTLPKDTVYEDLLTKLPSIEEAKLTNSFSFFCATTQAYFLVISMLILFLANQFFNVAVSICLSFSFAYLSIYFIQKNISLEEPSERELQLAIKALETLLKGD